MPPHETLMWPRSPVGSRKNTVAAVVRRGPEPFAGGGGGDGGGRHRGRPGDSRHGRWLSAGAVPARGGTCCRHVSVCRPAEPTARPQTPEAAQPTRRAPADATYDTDDTQGARRRYM